MRTGRAVHERRTAITCRLIKWVGVNHKDGKGLVVEMRFRMRHDVFEREVKNEGKRRHIKRVLVFLVDRIVPFRHYI